MLAGAAADADKPCYFRDTDYQFDGSGTGAVTVGTSIQHPYVFYNDGGLVFFQLVFLVLS